MGYPSARELLDHCARGPEAAAWGEFVQRYGPAIEAGVRRALRRAGSVGPGPDRLEDLVQECYIRLLESRGRRLRGFRGAAEAELRSWLGRVAERTALDRLRAASAAKRGQGRLWPLADRWDKGLPADPAPSPDRRLLGRERLCLLARRWRRLAGSEREARVLRLVFLHGLSSREVADASGGALTPSSVDSVVFRFRRRLKAEGLPVPERG